MFNLLKSNFLLNKKEKQSNDIDYLKRRLHISYLISILGFLIIAATFIFLFFYQSNIYNNSKLNILNNIFYKQYYKQDNLKIAMKNVLGDSYIEGDESNFSNYVMALVGKDISKYEEDKWKGYTGFISSENFSAYDSSLINSASKATYNSLKKINENKKFLVSQSDDIYYIDIKNFVSNITVDLFEKKLDEMKKYSSLILDLRNNSGGDVKELIKFLELFNDKGTLFLENKCFNGVKEIETKYIAKTDKKIHFDNIVILINEKTASCAELAALSLKDTLTNVKIIGTNSYGKGIGTKTISFNDGSAFVFISTYWYTPSKINYHNKGIEPDIFVENKHNEDTQLLKAVEYLNNK